MVADKIYSRSQGKVTNLTRQPTEGRVRGGGLRYGEMERDCIISHGAASFLRERLLMVSDASRAHVCRQCGMIAIADPENRRYFCRVCKDKKTSLTSALDLRTTSKSTVVQVILPYSAKLLL